MSFGFTGFVSVFAYEGGRWLSRSQFFLYVHDVLLQVVFCLCFVIAEQCLAIAMGSVGQTI